MAPSEAAAEPAGVALSALRLGDADVLAGVALSDAAGWNQTADDWSLFVRHGVAIGRRSARSELVATAATLPVGGALAWISMVLVARDWQHRGLATQLLGECIAHLRAQHRTPVLDATPAGEAVYRRLGFAPGFGFARWARPAPVGAACAPAAWAERAGRAVGDAGRHRVREATAADLPEMLALDRAASGLERAFLLRNFLARQGTRAWVACDPDGTATGFALARLGRHAAQIGPLSATNAEQASALFDVALSSTRGTVYVDLPAPRDTIATWLTDVGFAVQRPFVRMALADDLPDCVAQPSARLFAMAGPEFG